MTFVQILIYFTSSLLIIAFGLSVLLQNKQSNSNRTFFFLALTQFFWILSLFLGYLFSFKTPPLLNVSIVFFRLAFAFGISMLFGLITFFYYFQGIFLKGLKYIKRPFLMFWFTVFIVTAFTPLVHESQFLVDGVYNDSDIFGPLYPFYNFLTLLLFVASALLVYRKLHYLKGIARAKARIAAVATWIFLLFAALTNVFLPLMGIWNIGFIDIQLLLRNSPVFTLIFTIPTFYSIRRYRFYNFSNVSLNLLRRFILDLIFFVSILLMYNFFNMFISSGIIRAFGSSFVAIYIYRYAENKIPLLLTSNFKEFTSEIEGLRSKVYHCDDYKDLNALLEKSFLVRLNFLEAKTYVVRSSKDNLAIPIYKKDDFTQALAQYCREGFLISEIDFIKASDTVKEALKLHLNALNGNFCLPLFSENNLIGFLVLSQKEDFYPKENIQLLLDLKHDLEIALMNILLKLNLKEENNLMKSIIDKKTGQLKRKIDKINELLDQQSDFIAVTAHEFRTPLSIAIFQLQEILSNTNSSSEAMNELRVLEDSLGELKNLTAKLFAVQQYDLSKVSLHLAPVQITTFFGKLFTNFEPIMKNRKLYFSMDFQIDKSLLFNIDHAQLLQVFHNILINASKFTPAGGDVSLFLVKDKTDIIISINDNGPGIPDAMKKSVFNKFRTKDKSAGSGVGLGLYICKKIIELHKGKIWVENGPNGGSSFKVKLPLA